MEAFAKVEDVERLFRPLSSDEIERCAALLPAVSDSLRQEAINRHKNLDKMLVEGDILPNVLISVTVDIVARTLMTSTTTEPMTQISESANGYSMSGSFLNPGGGMFIKNSELARLGLKRQKVEAWNLFKC